MRTILIAASLLAALTWTWAGIAAPIAGGPHATAAEVRAARGASTVTVRRLVFTDTTEGKAASQLRVDLASDYIALVRGDDLRIFDFKLRRELQADTKRGVFSNISLFADLGFRTAEFGNRHTLGKAGDIAGLKKTGMSTFENQAQLGLTFPNVPLVPLDVSRDGDSTVRISYDGKTFARIRFGDLRLAGDEQTAFLRFLHRGVVLHPGIVNAIKADGRLPSEFVFAQYHGFETKDRTLSLKSADAVQTDYPLPAQLEREPLGAPKARSAEIYPLMLDAVAGQAMGGPRTVASYREAIQRARAQNRPLQVMLLVLEANLQHGPTSVGCPAGGPPGCVSPLGDTIQWAGRDPQVQLLMTGLSFDGSGGGKGAEYFRKLDRTGLSNAYVLDIFTANELRKTREAEALFLSGIRGNPYVPSFYKDFGDYCFRGYDAWNAWTLYDLGRSLPDAGKTPMFDHVNGLEPKFLRDFPQFF